MSILAIADSLAALIEPDPTLRDDGRARPVAFEAAAWYAWPARETFAPLSNEIDEERFTISVAFAADRRGEADGRDRAVSELLQSKADAMAAAIRGRRSDGTTHENAQVDEIDYEAIVSADVRGFIARISGYQIRPD